MAVCPITKETFEPRNPDHVFKNNKAFQLFIERLDPLDEFKVKKRKIDWDPVERTCAKCGTEFVAEHPAMMYCELHRAPTDNDGESEAAQILVEEESSKIVRTRECDKCEHEFFMTAPNMKYCEECSTKGGVRVKVPSHSKH